VFYAVIHEGIRGPIYKAVDEGRVRILIDLLDPTRELIRWLSPVVVFHRDHEYRLDLLRAGVKVAQRT
jgi:hypothetical protein